MPPRPISRTIRNSPHSSVAEGIPTAPFLVVDRGPVAECPLSFPVIVKPAQQDASVGVTQQSVATDLAGLSDWGGDLVYLRSEQYLKDQLRANPEFESRLAPIFGEKEGKIAKIYTKVTPADHPKEVLEFVKTLK